MSAAGGDPDREEHGVQVGRFRFCAPPGMLLIQPREWKQQRWGWLESVRRDANLNPTARLVAHVLVLDFANHKNMRCDPPMVAIARAVDMSVDTVKRSVAALCREGWVVRATGRGPGNSNGYAFVMKGPVPALKQGKSASLKRGSDAPFHESQSSADLHPEGGKPAPPYHKDKPYKNHEARARDPHRSQNPWIISEAEDAVRSLRDGRTHALRELQPYVLDHVLAAELLTDDELEAAGVGRLRAGR